MGLASSLQTRVVAAPQVELQVYTKLTSCANLLYNVMTPVIVGIQLAFESEKVTK